MKASPKKKPEASKALVRLSSNLPYANRLASDLREMAKNVPEEATYDLGRAMLALKPVGKALGELETAVKKTLIDRAQTEKKASPFHSEDKHRVIGFQDGKVTVQTREQLIEREGALDWLYKHNRAVYLSSIDESVTVTNPAAFLLALNALSGSSDKSTVKAAVDALLKSIERNRSLKRSAIEQAVLDGKLTKDDVEHLYDIKTTYAVVVGAPSDAALVGGSA